MPYGSDNSSRLCTQKTRNSEKETEGIFGRIISRSAGKETVGVLVFTAQTQILSLENLADLSELQVLPNEQKDQ